MLAYLLGCSSDNATNNFTYSQPQVDMNSFDVEFSCPACFLILFANGADLEPTHVIYTPQQLRPADLEQYQGLSPTLLKVSMNFHIEFTRFRHLVLDPASQWHETSTTRAEAAAIAIRLVRHCWTSWASICGDKRRAQHSRTGSYEGVFKLSGGQAAGGDEERKVSCLFEGISLLIEFLVTDLA